MNRMAGWKRVALWMATFACLGSALAGCTTSRDQYSQSSSVSTYGVIDAGIEHTSR